MIVGRTHSIALHVRKLQFDMLVLELILIQDGRGEVSEAMTGHHALVPHNFESFKDRVFAHSLHGAPIGEKAVRPRR